MAAEFAWVVVGVLLLLARERVTTVEFEFGDLRLLFSFDFGLSGADRSMNERGDGVKLEPMPRYRCWLGLRTSRRWCAKKLKS